MSAFVSRLLVQGGNLDVLEMEKESPRQSMCIDEALS